MVHTGWPWVIFSYRLWQRVIWSRKNKIKKLLSFDLNSLLDPTTSLFHFFFRTLHPFFSRKQSHVIRLSPLNRVAVNWNSSPFPTSCEGIYSDDPRFRDWVSEGAIWKCKRHISHRVSGQIPRDKQDSESASPLNRWLIHPFSISLSLARSRYISEYIDIEIFRCPKDVGISHGLVPSTKEGTAEGGIFSFAIIIKWIVWI